MTAAAIWVISRYPEAVGVMAAGVVAAMYGDWVAKFCPIPKDHR